MKYNIADVLDKCIEELRRGKTQEECLAVYAGAAAELAPLLQTAVAVRQAPKAQASDAAMRASKSLFLQEAARLRSEQQKRPAKPWQRLALVASTTFVLPRPRALVWTPVLSIMLAFVLIMGTATTAIAASRSLPDEPLYAVKLAGEQVQDALTTDPVARADLALARAEKRLDEISTLSSLGRPVAAPSIERLTSDTSDALTSIGRIEDDAMRPRLQRYLGIVSQQQALLTQAHGMSSIAEAVSAALAVAQENEKLAETAVNDPSVLKDPSQRSGRGVSAAPKDTPTTEPTPDPGHMRTPAPAAAATATETAVPAQPTATNTALPPTATQTAKVVPPTATVVSTATMSPTSLPRIQFSGLIEKVTASEWGVDGKTIRIDDQTKIDGASAARPGARADVVAVAQANQSLLAISIKVYPLVEDPANTVTLRGIILGMSATTWNIGGQSVTVGPATTINGAPALGLIAEATGTRKNSDPVLATAITIKGAAPETQLQGVIDRITLQTWVIGGQSLTIVHGLTAISGTPAVGNSATVTALRQDNGGLIAKYITIQSPAPVVEEEFEGFINRIDGNIWTINGRRVIRAATTQVDESQGPAQIGQRARVRGTVQGDGSILAISIRILAPSGAGRAASPTVVVSPTVAPPTPTRGAAATATMVTSPLATPSPAATPTMTATPPAPSPTATNSVPMRWRTPTPQG